MQTLKQVMQHRPSAFSGLAPQSWKTAVHSAVLVAAFLFVTALVLGAI